jgi:hypothetical protein
MKTVGIDEKFSFTFDEQNNDKPLQILRYGEPHDTFDGKPNWVIALAYHVINSGKN